MHGFQATQMAAASSAPVETRAQAFGHVSFVYGSGFIVGTAVVALLGKIAAPQTIVLSAAGLETLILGAVAWQMKDTSALGDDIWNDTAAATGTTRLSSATSASSSRHLESGLCSYLSSVFARRRDSLLAWRHNLLWILLD
jgi:hypothetical protein